LAVAAARLVLTMMPSCALHIMLEVIGVRWWTAKVCSRWRRRFWLFQRVLPLKLSLTQGLCTVRLIGQ
jgi:hypothetical protein